MPAIVHEVSIRGEQRYMTTCREDGFSSPPIGTYVVRKDAEQSADMHNAARHPEETAPRIPEVDKQGRIVLRLTRAEYGALSEALRYSQQAHEELTEPPRLDPTLSRIQRKLGEKPNGS